MNDPNLRISVNDVRFNKKITSRIHKTILEHVGVMDIFIQLLYLKGIFKHLFYLLFVKPFIEHLLEAVIRINQNFP